VGSHRPLCRLSNLPYSFVLEHFDKVFLNTTLNHGRVLFGWTVDDGDLESDLISVRAIKFLPRLGVSEIEVHENGVVRPLSVDPDVAAPNDCMDLPEWANRISQAHIQVTLLAVAYTAELIRLDNILEMVALARQRIPKLKAASSVRFLAHDVDHVSTGHAVAKHYV